MPERGSQLDLSTEQADGTPPARTGQFLGVTFACCGIYARIYPNRTGDAYEGRCPRCLGKLRVGIGPGGSSNRFFTAS